MKPSSLITLNILSILDVLSIKNTVMFLKFFVINVSPSRIHILHTQILIEKKQFQNRSLADNKYSKKKKIHQQILKNTSRDGLNEFLKK